MNPNNYFDSKVAARSMAASAHDFNNDQTISLETQADQCFQDIESCIIDHPGGCIAYIKKLHPDDQNLLFSYYFLHKAQSTIAHLLGTNQTTISSKLRMAVLRLGANILFGIPSVEEMHDILKKVDQTNYTSTLTYAEIIGLYATPGSDKKLAIFTGLKLTIIRKILADLSLILIGNKDRHAQALGAYVSGLVEKASANRTTGLGKRALAKQAQDHRRDPDIVGKFEIDVTDKDFDQILMPAARSLTGDLSDPPRTVRGSAKASKVPPDGMAKSPRRGKTITPGSVAPTSPALPAQSVTSASSGIATPSATFADRLRELRLAWGLNQDELAELINSNQKSVSHWEQGRHHPRRAALEELVGLTGIPKEVWKTGVGFAIPERPNNYLGELTKAHRRGITVVLEPIPPGLIGVLDLDSPDADQKSIAPNSASKRLLKEHGAGRMVWIVVSSS